MKTPHPHAETLRAIADGEEIEFIDTRSDAAGWSLISSQSALLQVAYDDAHLKFRVKPKTIRIGDYDVPEPMRVAPGDSEMFYVPTILSGSLYTARRWGDFRDQQAQLAAGLCHFTAEAAELHAKALISLTSPTKE